jgi:DNA-binding transcriptional LysR family regulator
MRATDGMSSAVEFLMIIGQCLDASPAMMTAISSQRKIDYRYAFHKEPFGMRALNPDHLRTFVEVVGHGSFSAAAQRLSLTQPAVSQHIRALERRFGVRLVERVRKRARATTAGEELLKHARQIEAVFDRTVAALAAHRNEVVGRVRLGTGATACIYLLPPILRRLRQRFPRLEIAVKTGNTPDILRALDENALDLALVTLPAPGRNFDVTPIRDDELVAIFPRDGARLPAAASPAFLSERPVVLYETGGNARRVIDDWFVRAGLSLQPVMELGSVEAIKRLVAAGLGCAVLPRIAVGGGRGDGFRVRPLSPRLHRGLATVVRHDKVMDRGLREMMRALQSLKRSS